MRTVTRWLALVPLVVVSAVVAVVGPTSEPVSAASSISCTAPTGAPASTPVTGGFVGQIPERLVDTRPTGAVPAGCWLRVALPSTVPTGAAAVAVTLTSDRAAAPGFLTAHPCGSTLPPTSNLNVRPSGPTSNLAVVAVDATREVCVFNDRGTDVIVDLVGYFGPDGAPFHELAPARVVDTRDPGRRPPGVVGTVQPAQTAGVERDVLGVPEAATAVVVNLTVTQAEGPGYLTAFPCGGARPNTSNVNYSVGVDRANTAVMALGPQGSLCFETAEAAAHVIVDVIGWFGDGDDGDLAGGLDFRAGVGRIADSRNGTGGWNGPFAAGETRPLDPAASGALPAGTRVAVLGVVATRTTEAGFLAVRPCGDTSEVSSVNYVAGADITNVVTVPLSDDGRICVSASTPTDVVVDVLGGFRADGPIRGFEIGELDLWPSFAPDVTDYVAYCTQPTGNAFAFDVRGMPGTTIELVGRQTSSPRLTVNVTADADDALVLRVTPAGGTPTDYWIRCVPPDFPKVTTTRTGPTTPGWYLLTTNEFGIIADSNGVPVWYRRADEPARNPRNLMRLGPNELAWFQDRGFAIGVNPADGYERFRLDGTPTGPLLQTSPFGSYASMPTNHHDLVPLPNGNFLVMAMPLVQLAGPGPNCWINGPSQPFAQDEADEVAGAVIQEVQPDGTVVGSFDAAPALVDDGNTVPLCFRLGGDASKDYLTAVHINAMSAAGDLVVFSARHHDAVYGIRWSTKELLWKMGGANPIDAPDAPAEAVIVGDPFGGPLRQHDVHVEQTGPERYRLTMFDNRTPFSFANPMGAGPARFVEYDLDTSTNPPTATFVRQILRPDGFSSGSLGSARIQPDGAVVVGWGGVPGPTFTEFSAAGSPLFELALSPFSGNASYRAIKEPIGAFDLNLLRQTAGL